MKLNVSLIKSILNLYSEMQGSGIDLVYFGEFGQDVTKMFATMTDNKLEHNEEKLQVKKKVYHILVETLQNLNKHSDWLSDNNIGSGLFMIGRKDDSYYIITSNKVSKDKKVQLEQQLETLSEATIEELNEMYKAQLRNGRLSAKGGAGLGFIDITRKANKNVEYQFLKLDKDGFLFILKVEITAPK